MIEIAAGNTASAQPAPQALPAPQPQPAYQPAPQPAYQQPATQPQQEYAYDAFMTSLTGPERTEFCDLFIAKTKGDFGIPAYVIGGDNTAFFRKVFVSLGKFRPYITDGLLDKIYSYANH